jgi:hypothetical protein
MRSFTSAARRRGRTAAFLLLAVLFSFVSLYSEAAFSASLIVTIKKINPENGIQQVTCTARQKCVLPIAIQNGANKETITAHILFVPGSLLAKFQGPDGYYYAGDTGNTKEFYEVTWRKSGPRDKPETYDVTLFLPVVPHPEVAPILSVAHEAAEHITHAPVANLEITAQPAP